MPCRGDVRLIAAERKLAEFVVELTCKSSMDLRLWQWSAPRGQIRRRAAGSTADVCHRPTRSSFAVQGDLKLLTSRCLVVSSPTWMAAPGTGELIGHARSSSSQARPFSAMPRQLKDQRAPNRNSLYLSLASIHDSCIGQPDHYIGYTERHLRPMTRWTATKRTAESL